MIETKADADLAQTARIARAESNLTRLIDWVGKHDTKASVILGITTTMAGTMGALVGKAAMLTTAALALTVVSFVCFTFIYLSLYIGNFPRIRNARRSPIYFGSIALSELEDYRAEMRALEAAAYEDTLIDQCHVLASIVDAKFRWLTWAYRALFAVVPFWLFSLYLLFDSQ